MQLLKGRHYTYADYISWDSDVRYELINGTAYMMSPSPSREHQECSGSLYYQIYGFLNGKTCKVLAAPFDVCLNAGGDQEDTVVQPDLLVVCDLSKLDGGKACIGAPDMIIEILSPSTANRDRVVKFNKYLHAGVREYWLVDPDSKSVSVNILDSNRYYATAHSESDVINVAVLDGCKVNLQDVFRAV